MNARGLTPCIKTLIKNIMNTQNYGRFKKYRIIYTFNKSKFGFQNSITVTAQNVDNAIEEAKKEVAKCYGSGMLKSFTFKPDPTLNGVVI